MSVPPGTVQFRNVSRGYRLVLERNATLKETLLRRGRIKGRRVEALKNVDLDIAPGEAVGLVGANGAGKSTTLKLISGILPPDSGVVTTGGRVVSLLELGAGFHPDFTGRENVMLNASIHRIGRREVERRMDDIIAFSGLEQFIDAPVRTYSSGMYARLGFAVASQLEPDVLLLDEIMAVGDQEFQNRCLARVSEFKRQGVTIVFVSHSDGAIALVCDRAVWLAQGAIQADGKVDDVLAQYHRETEGGIEQPIAAAAEAAPPREGDVSGVRVAGAICRNGTGAAGGITFGEPFQAIVDVDVTTPQQVIVGIALRGSDGALLMANDTRGPEPAPVLDAGRHRFVFDVPRMPLHEGNFAVEVGLSSQAGTHLDRVGKATEFTLMSTGRGVGPVRFDGAWREVPPDEVPTVAIPDGADATGVLDAYCLEVPRPQNAIDIFAGEWAARFPDEAGVEAGDAPLFEAPHVPWGVNLLGGVEGRRVLELGPLEGGHTYMLDRMGAAEITSIEANTRAFLKTLITKEILRVPSSRVLCGEIVAYLDDHIAAGRPRFDLCVASGVLYHFSDPVAVLDRISEVADRLLLWTMYYNEDVIRADATLSAKFPPDGLTVARHVGFTHTLHRQEYQQSLSHRGFCGGTAESSAWLSRDDVLAAVEHVGFDIVEVGHEELNHKGNGSCLALAAVRRGVVA